MLLEPSIFDCEGEKEVSWTWELSVNTAGSMILSADAVDQELAEDSSGAVHQASKARRSPTVMVKVIK